ncbi:hypothetical protein PIB30_024640 [Stylosanthes scabra]|uniref:Uncharacterized protein n=1 Tax=Stylosanthes scabra TaxID=79078 RepID=A0ABU6X7D3_9FABA|nr:hypothetical protein [Stylosanthes scabra]
MLAKSLVNIAAMLKEIKEGQQVTPMLLKRQTDHSQQNSIKYCGICSCNSHHTNECPPLQEDNLGRRMNNKTSGVHLNRTNQDSSIIGRETTRTPDISPLTTVNNSLQQTTNRGVKMKSSELFNKEIRKQKNSIGKP